MTVISPVTNSTNVKLISQYNKSITSDSRLVDMRVDNYLCFDSGLIFNATGPRGSEKGFYVDEYDLHSENVVSEFQYFDMEQSIGIYDDILTFIMKAIKLSDTGKILDIGCGKGLFLRKFFSKNKNWGIYGIEPSRNASKFFSETLPNANIFEGVFEESDFKKETFDLITANGVLEHVPNPIEFLKGIRSCLNKDGFLYIGVPNFINNPADLFTFDHLSRFTPETISIIFEYSGFEIVAANVNHFRVPMWFILKPKELTTPKISREYITNAQFVSEQSLRVIKTIFDSYEQAMNNISKQNRKIGMYGTGAFGLIGMSYTQLTSAAIERIFDDNQSIWGEEKLGIKIDNPRNMLNHKNISDIIISANPCYFDLIAKKIRQIDPQNILTVHIPTIQ